MGSIASDNASSGPRHAARAGRPLQLLSIWQLAKSPVETTKRLVPRLASDLQDKAVGEAKRRPRDKVRESGFDDVGLLDNERIVLEQHLDGACQSRCGSRIDRVEDPDGLDQDDVRNPSTLRDERFGSSSLLRVVAGQQPYKHVGVKRAHGASHARGCLA